MILNISWMHAKTKQLKQVQFHSMSKYKNHPNDKSGSPYIVFHTHALGSTAQPQWQEILRNDLVCQYFLRVTWLGHKSCYIPGLSLLLSFPCLCSNMFRWNSNMFKHYYNNQIIKAVFAHHDLNYRTFIPTQPLVTEQHV